MCHNKLREGFKVEGVWNYILSSKLWTFLCQGTQESRVQVLRKIPREGHDIGKGIFCGKPEGLDKRRAKMECLRRTGFMKRIKNPGENG